MTSLFTSLDLLLLPALLLADLGDLNALGCDEDASGIFVGDFDGVHVPLGTAAA
jgi:hypothetical protein